ncbi:YkvA family protein [candidate division KSB1 bacterium]
MAEENTENREEFYLKLREKIKKWLESKEGKENRWADILMLAPDMFYLLWKLSLDPDVPAKSKAMLAGAVAYFVLPVDLLPEAILGPFGYLDDIALAAYVLNKVVNDTPPELIRKYWAGEHDILMVIKNVLGVADSMLGKGLWKKLKGRFE